MSDTEGKRKNLGRGLGALLGDDTEDYASLDRVRTTKSVPVDHIRPGKFQPRRNFDQDQLRDLTDSVKAKGILQPLLVRRDADDPTYFELVAGERRWLAAQGAQLHEVPVVIKDLTDSEALEIALIENLQRQDLSPLEEAEGYRRLMEDHGHTQEQLAQVVSKSRSHVANTLRLLKLPETVKTRLERGELTAGHARVLVTAEDPDALAAKIVSDGLNVREVESLVRATRAGSAPPRRAKQAKNTDTLALESELSSALGLKVEIKDKGNRGALIIRYRSLEQLDDVLQRLSRPSRDKV